jgi:16S rRNA (adenine1518-N6/adenine1519-N6)-dimethyltransferase
MMVRLRPHPPGGDQETDPLLLKQVVTAAFSHRRKTLRNSLSGLLSESRLVELGIKPGDRAENLGLADYVTLSKHLNQ